VRAAIRQRAWQRCIGTGIALAAVAATAGSGLGTASEAMRDGAELELVETRPVAVHGTGFRAHERIRVVLLRSSGVTRRRARAGPGGEFTRRFPAVSIDRCDSVSINAKGEAGSRATLLRRAPRGCPPP
jgi:hypothetical protein